MIMNKRKKLWRPKDWDESKILKDFYSNQIKLTPCSITERDSQLIDISVNTILEAISKEIASRQGERLDAFIYTLYSISNKGGKG